MKWQKKGLIYCPNGTHGWDYDTFMTPHAMLINDNVIRIYGGTRDKEGASRITYIDVKADNPKEIISIADKPVLDVGEPGTFDDNGVILGDMLKIKNQIYMYYVGFQHVQKAKFYAFSGLAISEDEGQSFKRYSQVPIMDRTDTGKFGRCIHTVLHENGIFKIYYAVIHDWHYIDGKPYPAYNIWYTESEDGKNVEPKDHTLCIDVNNLEYRIGRPKVYRINSGYQIFYTRDFKTKEYKIGYAESTDGKIWYRKDELVGIDKSDGNEWDSDMACYPVILNYKDKTYMFYGGNGMGKTGVGYAELVK